MIGKLGENGIEHLRLYCKEHIFALVAYLALGGNSLYALLFKLGKLCSIEVICVYFRF